ncbi:MAG: ABC1 kinase family protein [Kiloniellales bacterium]
MRYARVGGGLGLLAAQVLGARATGRKLDRGRHSAEMKATLGALKGPLMKVAQILATVPDALPPDYARALRELQSNAPPMGWAFVKRRMASELGPDWRRRFESFEQEAAAAASLGQVHRATALDGRLLACKLQYPNMRSAVAADLSQLKLAFALYRRYDRTIDTSDIHRELSERLTEELDYERERRHLALYRAMLEGETGVTVPEPVAGLSTRRLLTMTWLEGKPLLDFAAEAGQALRDKVALNLFRAWYRPFYAYGVIHGDPHLGNYSVRPDGHVNLLDFGCVRIFPPSFVRGVIDLYHALDRDDSELAVSAYETWGFRNLSRELLDALNIWARFLYAPLLDDKPQRILEEEGGLYGARVAGQVHEALRRLGGVKPPREFVLMDRAAIGLGSVFMHLKAEVNWHRLFRSLIDDFDEKALARRQAKALQSQGLSAAG